MAQAPSRLAAGLPAQKLDTLNPKRNAVLEAAAEMFLARGYEAVSMDAIATAAGVSKRTVYSYFERKEDLFTAIMVAHCESFGGIVLPTSGQGQPPRETLIAYGRAFLRMITSPRAVQLQRVLFAEVGRLPEIGLLFWQAGPERHCTALAAYLREAALYGRLAVSAPEEAAVYFINLVKSRSYLPLLCGIAGSVDECEIEAAVTSAVDFFLKAVAPAPSPLTAAPGLTRSSS